MLSCRNNLIFYVKLLNNEGWYVWLEWIIQQQLLKEYSQMLNCFTRWFIGFKLFIYQHIQFRVRKESRQLFHFHWNWSVIILQRSSWRYSINILMKNYSQNVEVKCMVTRTFFYSRFLFPWKHRPLVTKERSNCCQVQWNPKWKSFQVLTE